MNDVAALVAEGYIRFKGEYPQEGRRHWKVRAVNQLWNLQGRQAISNHAQALRDPPSAPWASDPDLFDLDDRNTGDSIVGLKGVIVRTDYANDVAWERFVSAVKETEAEGIREMSEKMQEDDGGNEGDEEGSTEDEDEDNEDEERDAKMDVSEAGQEGTTTQPDPAPPKGSAFHIVELPPDQRHITENASNLRLLRLFNDVDIVEAPKKPPPEGVYYVGPQAKETTISPDNKLVEKFGLKEVYPGRVVWVYDARSNDDMCARLIRNGVDDGYGSYTGDSWRTKASHIWELQVHLDAGALKIGFMGDKGWDANERRRNFEDAGVIAAI
ncbi:hypothetical protein FRB99_004053 [Tulasnella sp. 403]|nr:hypothetical protein FRB99_004053 [Tulasnella sp. 403]